MTTISFCISEIKKGVLNFLNTVELIDWNIYTKDLTLKEYMNFIGEPSHMTRYIS